MKSNKNKITAFQLTKYTLNLYVHCDQTEIKVTVLFDKLTPAKDYES
jgi:hypothetical protein